MTDRENTKTTMSSSATEGQRKGAGSPKPAAVERTPDEIAEETGLDPTIELDRQVLEGENPPDPGELQDEVIAEDLDQEQAHPRSGEAEAA